MRRTFAIAGWCLLLVAFGCGKTEEAKQQNPSDPDHVAVESDSAQPAEDVGDSNQPPSEKTAQNGIVVDPNYPIPDLAPPELLGYINQLASLEPYGATDEEYVADQIGRAKSRLLAADRIILAKDTEEDLVTAAVNAKLDALKMLALLDPQGLGVNFQLFVDALAKGNSSEYARLARISQFWLEVDKLMYGQSTDPAVVVNQTKKLVEYSDAGEAEFLAAQDASFVLNERGFADEATDVLKLIGNTFASHQQLGSEAKDLLEKTAFREKVIAAMQGGKPEVKTLFVAIRDLLTDKTKLDVITLDNTLNAGQVLEYNGHFNEAKTIFAAIKKAFARSDDEQLVKQAKISVEFAEKRLAMIGKEIDIEGIQMDGSSFNWEKYKGKVVLVDFWASTSSPWQASLPSIKATYDQHHDAGFEVIGINVDRDRQNAYDYLRSQRLPWTLIMDEVSPGLDANPNAIRYGIRAVPFVMLLGRDGKVADIHVRGQKLASRVEELLEMPTSKNAQAETANRK